MVGVRGWGPGGQAGALGTMKLMRRRRPGRGQQPAAVGPSNPWGIREGGRGGSNSRDEEGIRGMGRIPLGVTSKLVVIMSKVQSAHGHDEWCHSFPTMLGIE